MRSIVILVAGLALATAGCANRAMTQPPSGWRADQEVWWTTPDLVKNAIVAYLRFLDENPDAERAPSPYWEIVSLALLLDRREEPEALEALADLTSYYVGESGNELLHCVVLRSGPGVAPFLKERLRSGPNDCQTVLGATSKQCLAERDYRAFLEATLAAINRDESCHVER